MSKNSSKKKSRRNKPQANSKANVSALGQALRSLGGLGGSALGAFMGAPASGGVVGNHLGAALSRWLGAGDYTLSQNSVVTKASSSIPDMHKSNQSITVRHREFIAQITGSTAFTMQHEFRINPGLSSSFPWLSTIATSFQEYNVKGLVFHYVPTSGNAVSSTNAALGSVMIQTSYRANDSAPSSKAEMLNEFWANETVPSETLAHPIECDPKENPFAIHYVRSHAIPNGDVLLYDVGTTYVATAGMQSANVVGDLWVTYEIEFKKPIVSSNVSSLSGFYSAVLSGGDGMSSYFGVPLSEFGNLSVDLSGRTITFQKERPGNYLIAFELQGPFSGASGFTGSVTYTHCAAWAYDNYSVVSAVSATTCTNLNVLGYTLGVVITDPGAVAVVNLPPASATGTLQGTSIQITYLGPAT